MSTASQAIAPKRILYVEDDSDSRELLCVLLKNHELVTAATATHGAKLARVGRFDLYVLDNRYEDGSGIELCRQIRTFDSVTPVLFFSGMSDSRHIREAENAGAQEYLIKPRDIAILEEAVERLLGGGPSH